MTATHINIEWIDGARFKSDEDDYRAQAAAYAAFEEAGVDPVEAQAEYQRQWAEFDDEAPMTGLALVWMKARDAANVAATEGWYDTNGGFVTIEVGTVG